MASENMLYKNSNTNLGQEVRNKDFRNYYQELNLDSENRKRLLTNASKMGIQFLESLKSRRAFPSNDNIEIPDHIKEHIGDINTILIEPNFTVSETDVSIIETNMWYKGQRKKVDGYRGAIEEDIWFNPFAFKDKAVTAGAFKIYDAQKREFHTYREKNIWEKLKGLFSDKTRL